MINNRFDNYSEIVKKNIHLIDVRAPVEFEKGTFQNSVNLPIMNNEERRLVGTCYKEKGSEEAVKLGHELVSGTVKEERVRAWAEELQRYPQSIIYCFRGGMRSQITQQWIFEATQIEVPRIEGGYKAFRNFLMNTLVPSENTPVPVLLGGCTGSGKTILLKKLINSIDLEALANHRGSSFGNHITPQPGQIDFENNLAYQLIRYQDKGFKHVVLEDEGSHVGKCFIPNPLRDYINNGNLVLVEVPLEERIENTMDEYVIESQKEYVKVYGEDKGIPEWYNYIRDSIVRVKSRLGGDRLLIVLQLLEDAYNCQMQGDINMHREWISFFLKEYYDPMYNYQIQKTKKKIVFRGNKHEVMDYLKNLS